MRLLPTFVITLIAAGSLMGADGDTIHIKTVAFGAPQSGTYAFPADSVRYQKVLMHYTLRCPSGGCGQWDYLDYVYLDQHRHNPDTTIRYELMRYITPYGIGLSLGSGFTWTIDVTDYSPLLHDSVSLNAGNGNEEVQLTFDIITGTPPRDVIKIEPLWVGAPRYGLTPPIDSFLVPMSRALLPDAKGVRLKVIQTGHGEDNHKDISGNGAPCAEFCDNVQYINVFDTVRYARHVFRATCGDNPVYPQGGTWVINRANWCPGAEVETYDYELTPYVRTGSPLKVQLTMDPYTYVPGATNDNTTPYYVISSYLVQYGAPHFTTDAAIEGIMAPTTTQLYQRHNPICNGPIVIIRNTGSSTLHSLKFEYGVHGGNRANYSWNGSLAFMQYDTLHLPPFDWGAITGSHVFDVTISNPNGQTDEYAANNYASSNFFLPPVWYSDLEIHLRTNLYAAQQYEWWLRSADGAIIAHRNSLSDNTTYLDTFHLADGCYEFQLLNYLQYGLSWQFTQSQFGSGSLSFTSKNLPLKGFNGDFGREIYTQFRVGVKPTAALPIDTLKYGTVPVGGTKKLHARITPANSAELTVTSVAMFLARNQFAIDSASMGLLAGPVTLQFGDTMDVIVDFTPTSAGMKSARLNFNTNDERNGTAGVALIGNPPPVGIEETISVIPSKLFLDVHPSVLSSEGMLTFASGLINQHARITLVNALGKVVQELYNGLVSTNATSIPLSTVGLPAGPYYVVLSSTGGTTAAPMFIVR